MYSNLYALYKFPYTSQQFIFVLGLLGKISCRFGPGCAVSLKKSQPLALNKKSSIYYHYFDFNLFYIYIRAHNENKPKRFTLV